MAMPLPDPTGNPELHVLRRISFGLQPGDLAYVKSIGSQAYADEQLNYEQLPDAEDRLAGLNLLAESPAELVQNDVKSAQVLGQLVAAKLLRALYSRQQLFEVMTEFWSDHFNLYALKSPVGLFLPFDQRHVIRQHALGKFHDLLAASAHSPAMLLYLDNATSTAKAPNENYAREIMELHTLGVTGGYTQQDVHEVARALTGWSVAGQRDEARVGATGLGQFLYRPFSHDNQAKTMLGITLPAGRGQADGDRVIDGLASHPSTAKFIATKLCRRFVSDNPPPSVVDRATDVFQQSEGDIRSVVRTILTSAEFVASAGQKYKRPFDFIASTLRALNADVTLETPAQPGDGLKRNPVLAHLQALGQMPFLWPTPDGYPDSAAAWLNTNGMLERWNFGLALAAGMEGVTLQRDQLIGTQTSAEELVDRTAALLLGTTLPEQPRAILIDYARTAAAGMRWPGLVALVIGSPQFQVK